MTLPKRTAEATRTVVRRGDKTAADRLRRHGWYLIDPLRERGGTVRREDERSLWLNQAMAAKLVLDPVGVIERAKERLQQLRRTHRGGGSDQWFDKWQQALDEGPDAVLAIMTSRSDEAQVMRSTSPLSGLGLLSDDERAAILAAFRRHWDSNHQGGTA